MDFRLEDPAAPSGLKMHLASPNQMAQVGRSPTEYFVLAPQVHGMTRHSTVQKKTGAQPDDTDIRLGAKIQALDSHRLSKVQNPGGRK